MCGALCGASGVVMFVRVLVDIASPRNHLTVFDSGEEDPLKFHAFKVVEVRLCSVAPGTEQVA